MRLMQLYAIWGLSFKIFYGFRLRLSEFISKQIDNFTSYIVENSGEHRLVCLWQPGKGFALKVFSTKSPALEFTISLASSSSSETPDDAHSLGSHNLQSKLR